MAFLGMRGTGDWATNERPENWRETVLRLYPNGQAPLTAINSMLGSEQTDDPVYHWWTKGLPEQSGEVTDVFDDSGLNTATTAGKSAGATVHVQVDEDTATEFRAGHTAQLYQPDGYNTEVPGEVTSVTSNGTQSVIALKLYNAAPTTNLTSSTMSVDVMGNVNAEGAEMPSAISYDPVEYFNYTQIFRTPLSITRTARKTRLRTGDAYTERKRETLELHAIEIEKASLFGVKSTGVGANGKPKRSTQGVIPFIKENASENVTSYTNEAAFSGKNWTASDGGELWLNESLERIFRFGDPEKLGLIGNKALMAIQELANNSADVNIEPMTAAYGLRVVRWITPFGEIFLKTHPLFNRSGLMRRNLLILEPGNMMWRYVDDTFFIDDPQDRRNRNNSKDATEEEFLTEGGYEWHHAHTMGYLTNLGQDA